MKISLKDTIDAWYEWEPTADDAARALALFGQPLDSITSLSLGDLCRLLFPDVAPGLAGGEQLALLSARPLFRGRMPRPVSSRTAPGRMGHGDEA